MKNILLLFILGGFTFTGCRTAFPEAQTPDDVYYSPELAGGDYERVVNDEDRYLRMKVRNRRHWNDLNDWYMYERWGYGMNYAFGTPFHPFYNWNVIHNPYWGVFNGTRTPNRPRISNLNTYQAPSNNQLSNRNPVNPKLNSTRFNNTNNNQTNRTYRSVGSGLRDLFGNGSSGSSSESSNSRPATNSNSTPSAPVRKF